MEEELCDKVVELCSAIVHLEATSLLTATPTTQDKNLIGLLHQYGSIAKELQACMEELSQVSDILPNLEVGHMIRKFQSFRMSPAPLVTIGWSASNHSMDEAETGRFRQ